MEKPKKIYWKGIEQLKNDPSFVKNNEKEFSSELPINDAYGDNSDEGDDSVDATRRDFLKTMGFGITAVSLAACEAPVRNAIPYLNKPEDIDPSIPNYYASTFADGSDYCSVVIKTREGRPIFVQGNTYSKVSQGGTNARVNASILSLYDEERQKAPTKGGEASEWATADKEIQTKLAEISAAGGQIRIVSNSIISPSTKKVIKEFGDKLGNVKHVSYDQESYYGMAKANENMFGKKAIPSYDFGKADVVVSLGADFMGGWISPIEYSKQFAPTRKVSEAKREMSRLYSLETMMSITGASADYRQPIKPSQEGTIAGLLYDLVASATGGTGFGFTSAGSEKVDKLLKKAATDLAGSKGKSLVVSGSNDTNVQMLVNGINEMLGNYGTTIDRETTCNLRQGDDAEMKVLVDELYDGKIDAVIFYNSNPVYDHPLGARLAEGINKTKLSISTADRLHETAGITGYNCPDSHYLESWNDAEPKKGSYSLGQPTISTIFNTRQAQDSLIQWAELEGDYLTRLKKFWESELMPQSSESSFEKFWFRALHNGVFDADDTASAPVVDDSTHATVVAVPVADETVETEEVAPVASSSVSEAAAAFEKKYVGTEDLELVVYNSSIMGVGTQSNNPILQETPDGITRVCWGSYLAVPQAYAQANDFGSFETQATVAKLTVNGKGYDLPVISQPGLAKGVVAVPLGYGRGSNVGRVAVEAGGVNAFAFTTQSQNVSFTVTKGISVENTHTKQHLAQTQTHHTIMGRETIIQESTLSEYKNDQTAGRFFPKISTYTDKKSPSDISLWDVSKDGYQEDAKKAKRAKEEKSTLWNDRVGNTADKHVYPNHHWGMAIDLNTCTGCASCVVACHMENNVPVVGKDEVVRRREMHWLRIDRYYSNPADADASDYSSMEEAAENPEVVFQPMMCQHCNNAPCETVCPVAATTHSTEGVNQMTYNRCVGTKYCANNCPYKVRRFNWFRYHTNDRFDYHLNNKLGKMVLNPDVTVRSRGVMEKCSLCIQRIQSGKLRAKIEKRKVKDGDVTTACASACPTDAISFGDLNDTESSISQLMDKEITQRGYNVLEEINVSPNVWYLTKIRNKDGQDA